jgi:hypothetical protein
MDVIKGDLATFWKFTFPPYASRVTKTKFTLPFITLLEKKKMLFITTT